MIPIDDDPIRWIGPIALTIPRHEPPGHVPDRAASARQMLASADQEICRLLAVNARLLVDNAAMRPVVMAAIEGVRQIYTSGTRQDFVWLLHVGAASRTLIDVVLDYDAETARIVATRHAQQADRGRDDA